MLLSDCVVELRRALPGRSDAAAEGVAECGERGEVQGDEHQLCSEQNGALSVRVSPRVRLIFSYQAVETCQSWP